MEQSVTFLGHTFALQTAITQLTLKKQQTKVENQPGYIFSKTAHPYKVLEITPASLAAHIEMLKQVPSFKSRTTLTKYFINHIMIF